MAIYCDLYQFHLLCNIVHIQYVSIDTYDAHRMMYNIYLDCSGLKLVFKVNGDFIYLTLDDLYKQIMKLLALLSPDTTICSFSLIILFYNVLGVKLRKAIILDGYILLNNSTLFIISLKHPLYRPSDRKVLLLSSMFLRING